MFHTFAFSWDEIACVRFFFFLLFQCSICLVLTIFTISYLILPPLFFYNQCLRPPYGVIYLATKKNYVGFNNGARVLRNLVDEEGFFGVHLVKEMSDRDVWKFFLK